MAHSTLRQLTKSCAASSNFLIAAICPTATRADSTSRRNGRISIQCSKRIEKDASRMQKLANTPPGASFWITGSQSVLKLRQPIFAALKRRWTMSSLPRPSASSKRLRCASGNGLLTQLATVAAAKAHRTEEALVLADSPLQPTKKAGAAETVTWQSKLPMRFLPTSARPGRYCAKG